MVLRSEMADPFRVTCARTAAAVHGHLDEKGHSLRQLAVYSIEHFRPCERIGSACFDALSVARLEHLKILMNVFAILNVTGQNAPVCLVQRVLARVELRC